MSASPFSLRLNPETKTRLAKAAKREDRSAGQVVQRAVEQYLDAQDYFLEEMRRVDKAMDNGRFVSWEKVKPWMESWDTDHELPPPRPDSMRKTNE